VASPRSYPALEVCWSAEPHYDVLGRVLATIDDQAPVAAHERDAGAVIFFSTSAQRDFALQSLARELPACEVSSVDVPDDDWAAQSQASLQPVRVGRLVIAPPWAVTPDGAPHDVIVIKPSMGFGTGHHATTQVCLALMQEAQLAGAAVLDVGTGSGVLAIAAVALGASHALAIDTDADAIDSARENVDLNGVADRLTLQLGDIADLDLNAFDLVIANLTGALLQRMAPKLAGMTGAGGRLIVSGILEDEGEGVIVSFETTRLERGARLNQDGWIGLEMRSPAPHRP
jgi:ribosomal protein L11 methyltransferase